VCRITLGTCYSASTKVSSLKQGNTTKTLQWATWGQHQFCPAAGCLWRLLALPTQRVPVAFPCQPLKHLHRLSLFRNGHHFWQHFILRCCSQLRPSATSSSQLQPSASSSASRSLSAFLVSWHWRLHLQCAMCDSEQHASACCLGAGCSGSSSGSNHLADWRTSFTHSEFWPVCSYNVGHAA